MARNRRELWSGLVHPTFGGPVFPVVVVVEIEGTTALSVPIYAATRDVAIRRATLAQEVSPDGAKSLNIRNATDNEDLATAIDSDALAADIAEDFVMNDNADLIEEGDVLELDYAVTTAGTTAPEEVVVVLEVELLELKDN